MDHVIDHDGQVLSVSATPGPGARTLCRDADRAGCRPCEHEHGRQPAPACGCSPADAQPARTRPRNRPPICLRHAYRGSSVLQRRHWAAVTDGGGGSTCCAQVADVYRRCSFGFASAGRAELATMCSAADPRSRSWLGQLAGSSASLPTAAPVRSASSGAACGRRIRDAACSCVKIKMNPGPLPGVLHPVKSAFLPTRAPGSRISPAAVIPSVKKMSCATVSRSACSAIPPGLARLAVARLRRPPTLAPSNRTSPEAEKPARQNMLWPTLSRLAYTAGPLAFARAAPPMSRSPPT